MGGVGEMEWSEEVFMIGERGEREGLCCEERLA